MWLTPHERGFVSLKHWHLKRELNENGLSNARTASTHHRAFILTYTRKDPRSRNSDIYIANRTGD